MTPGNKNNEVMVKVYCITFIFNEWYDIIMQHRVTDVGRVLTHCKGIVLQGIYYYIIHTATDRCNKNNMIVRVMP